MEISASKDNNEELPNGNNFEGHAPWNVKKFKTIRHVT